MPGALEGREAVLVLPQRGYREEELELPRQALEAAGARVRLASSSLASARGMHGGQAQPDVLYCALDPARLDALVFVGGTGACEYFPDRTAHRLACELHAAGKVVGALCFASSTLAEAGLLEGRPATGYPSRADHLRARGAIYRDEPAVVAGTLVTGRGPEDAGAFARALVETLSAR